MIIFIINIFPEKASIRKMEEKSRIYREIAAGGGTGGSL